MPPLQPVRGGGGGGGERGGCGRWLLRKEVMVVKGGVWW